jgi:hypothetical protein
MKLIPLLLGLIACYNLTQPNLTAEMNINQINYSQDTLKPVILTQYSNNIDPVIFEAAFYIDTRVKQGNLEFPFYTFELGKINIESGKIIACDPIIMQTGIAFAQNFPIGQFPVQLAMAKMPTDERVAFSRILFSDKAVAKWEFALKPGQLPISLHDTSVYCYGVDGGIGIFIYKSANEAFSKKTQSEWANVFVQNTIHHDFKGFVYDFDAHNLACFMTGYGDGCYSTYIGFDDKGNICRLLTDFGLVGWWNLKDN